MEEENSLPLVTTTRISTVVPATPRGNDNENDNVFHLGYMGLLMKLHYIRAVYFFTAEAAQGLSDYDLKKPMFSLLDACPHVSGWIRRSESGRPVIKCNDAGVRIVESRCDDATLEEWLQYQNGDSNFDDQGLVHYHVLGPDLGFSPLVFLKFTWFKCGGLCVGLSWSHVLGDAISAFNFITMWSQLLAGHDIPPKSLPMPNPKETQHNFISTNIPISVKKATIIGEQYWLANNDIKMVTHTFYITSKQLDHLATTTSTTSSCGENKNKNSYFVILAALVWKCIACIREDNEPKVVTICTRGTNHEFPIINNDLVLSIVEANDDGPVAKLNVLDLARLIAEEKKVENHKVEKLVEESKGKEDFIVYGANLTFVDLEEANNIIYGVKLNGQKPIMANCAIHGVGDQGVVLVLPALEDSSGRMITISLPEKELEQLKDKMGGEWGIASHPF